MKLSWMETAQLCRSLSLLLHSGITLAEGLQLLARTEEEKMQRLLSELALQLETGSSLSDAMASQGVFSCEVTGLVRAGEKTGRLEEALRSLAEYYEDRVRITRQLRSALAYPCLLLMLLLGVLGVLLVQVLPVFDRVYASLGSGMTGVAGGLLALGRGLKRGLPVLLAAAAAAAAVLVLLGVCRPFREKLAAWFSRRFGDRGVGKRFHNARFAKALAMGLGSGLPLEEAAELSRQLLSDVPGAAERCRCCAAVLKKSGNLAAAMAAAELLTPAQSRLLELGLRGGNADRVMEHLAGELREDAGQALETVLSRVEPALVLGASVLVGTILLAVMLPLMEILSAIG